QYRGLDNEDDIVSLLNHCIFDLNGRPPSIDTPLHGLLPFNHIDHLHPDAIIAIAAAKNGEDIARDIWGDDIGWIPWQRPGFDLGLKLEKKLGDNPGMRGVILQNHGLFTWGDTSYSCYLNSLEVIEMAAAYIDAAAPTKTLFGGVRLPLVPASKRRKQAAQLAPILRGFCASDRSMVGHFNDTAQVLEFINSNDLGRLAPMGTSCPDHFLRTKIKPLVLDLEWDADLTDAESIKEQLSHSFQQYRKEYAEYYNTHKVASSPGIRDPNPVVIIYPGIGIFTFAKNKQTARVASEFYVNAINVMRGSETISEYTALPRQEAFNIEYWLLEEAKLKRMPPERPLTGKVAFVTGGSGGIGSAIAQKFVEEGAAVVLTDVDGDNLHKILTLYQTDQAVALSCDVTNKKSIKNAYDKACLAFGGVDIIVHSAGLAISKPLEETTSKDWQILQDVMVRGQFLIIQKGVDIMRKQQLGGNVVNIASKNGLVSGPNNVAYGTAKAAQQHMTRLLATELAKDKIRVNTINPDGVIVGSKIWEGKWAKGRAESNGVSVAELPEFYAKRNLLKEVILPEDIANGVFSMVGVLTKSTGNTINVDGGMPNAFVR
ncbi:MAG: bifunctional rhamnulose-1-phosphate aldolase/short-chain dehydrogenase, partial [Flavobacteriaceae bacterium]